MGLFGGGSVVTHLLDEISITQLTSITNEMVVNAPVFVEWCFLFGGECQVQAWSDCDFQ